jgi:tetratricopeptide (TPR) repeat protein
MKKASFGWQCCLFAALVCGWVVLAQSQSKKLWQVYADAGEMAFKESRQSTAEVMFLSAIKEAESEGVQDPWLGKINYELGDLYSSLGRLKEAEPAYNRAIAIFEKLSGGEDRKTLALQIAERLERLAELYGGDGRNEQSALVYKQALEIRQSEFGQGDAGSIATTKAYIAVLRKLKRDAEAQELEARLGLISK